MFELAFHENPFIFVSALAHVVENTAFFGDILLRLPDITHKVKSLLIFIQYGLHADSATQARSNRDELDRVQKCTKPSSGQNFFVAKPSSNFLKYQGVAKS